MKIERLSENSIRCTLNRADLESRELKLSELAYGTEKAKSLFKDMIAQASFECGFEAEDIPLMIEAIPVSLDCIILVITKVEDPEELDTRFSKFAPSGEDDDEYDEMFDGEESEDGNVLEGSELFNKINEALGNHDDFIPFPDLIKKAKGKKDAETSSETGKTDEIKETTESEEPVIIAKLFSFANYGEAAKAAGAVNHMFLGQSSLYKNPSTEVYYLLVDNADTKPDAFTGICNVLTEYGKKEKFSYATENFLKEHCSIIIKKDAVKILTLY